MQASERARDLERVFQNRKGHAAQISISDENHHVTEAIGDMYGDFQNGADSTPRSSRPLSFISGSSTEIIDAQTRRAPLPPSRLGSNERVPTLNGTNEESMTGSGQMDGGEDGDAVRHDGVVSPPLLNRTPSDTASHKFELNLDYSKPQDLAQELSNLQAIRRMSMDVNSQDPDLPSFNPNFRVPSLAPPSHGADDGDPSSLFWVPARLHPELAPKEFKTFIEDKVKTIKRTSAGEDQMLSGDGLQRHNSGDSMLRRKKSMLSRQIDSGVGYGDGIEKLERNRSQGSDAPSLALKDLEDVLTDPTSLVRKLSIDASRTSLDSGISIGEDDSPILPHLGGAPLKRSTRTTYRKGGSLRRGEKLPFSKRLAARQAESDTDMSPTSPADIPDVPHLPLQRVQTEPLPSSSSVGNFSRPGRRMRAPASDLLGDGAAAADEEEFTPTVPLVERARNANLPSQDRNDSALHGSAPGPVPQIVETPPPTGPGWDMPPQHPQRSSSRGQTSSPEPPLSQPPSQPLPNRPRPAPHSRPSVQRHAPLVQQVQRAQTFDDIASNPSVIPGNATRTDALSVIPTLQEDTQKKKPKKDETRKASWGWPRRGGDDSKEKERTEKAEKDNAKKTKRSNKSLEVSDGRLDALDRTIDSSRSRESFAIDRPNIQLDPASAKDQSRKSSDKKGNNIFSSLFGGQKKDKEPGHRKGSSQRGLSPDPPQQILRPDLDYNWTRFSMMEERAIYRMAHIKLANPRRELYSQVLLSNFMYSYLAKVQSQHPQFQVQGNMPQKRGGRGQNSKQEQQQQQQQQPEEYAAYQRYQEQQARNESAHQQHQQYQQQQQEQQQQQQQMNQHNQQRGQGRQEQEDEDVQGGAVGGGGRGRQDLRTMTTQYGQYGGPPQQQQQQQQQSRQQQHQNSPYGQNGHYGNHAQQQEGMVQGGQGYGGGGGGGGW